MEFKGLEIKWLGHSGFLIKSKSHNIYIDPFKINSYEKADLILITHSHYDHCSIEDIDRVSSEGTIIVMPADCQSKIAKINKNLDVKLIEPNHELNIDEMKIISVPAYNLTKQFHSKEDGWVGYIIEVEGARLYHSGDCDLIPEMQGLGKLDVAFLPVGGGYTMTAEEAAKAAIILKPELAIPMHYEGLVGSKEDALKFKEICEQEGIKTVILED